ncbi:unnamed protein product [Discula destructiva]
MPAPTRKSTRGAAARGAPSGKQATLSFNNRVSKVGAVKATGKDKDVKPESPIATPPSSKEAEVDDVEIVEEAVEVEDAEDKPEDEVRAEKISDAQIRKYWKGVEEARLAKRVHQEDLGLGEKVLRYFDISSQYGPCIGIPRTKRWYRAERLGLNPPIEVLAVLVKEKPADADVERSALDRLMSSTAIGSG